MNRQAFLRILGVSSLLPLSWLWSRMILTQDKYLTASVSQKKFRNLADGINLFDEVIIVRNPGKTMVFSSRCTHAGCRITRSENNILLCPCHGSRYDATTGKVLKGPAFESLHPLPFSLDQITGTITVKI
ncbi:MAG: Rieske (2Fe-2S) protein [Bacteroidetes bacterium]|nr:Rieske (2Fe-2S) protein [Bacteroidota bacterium]